MRDITTALSRQTVFLFNGRWAVKGAEMPAGGVAVFTGTSLHRSGANTTSRLRRARPTQYTRRCGRPTASFGGQAVPFVSTGRYGYDPGTAVDVRTGRPLAPQTRSKSSQ